MFLFCKKVGMPMVETSVCAEKHKRVDERLDTHERRLNNHGDRLDKLEQYQAAATAQISHLCDQIKSLVKAIWWAIGLTITTLLGFFVWYIQSLK
jgi:hypothetical protein